MRTPRTARPAAFCLAALAAWCVLATPSAAQERQLALDSGGKVYRLVEGAYGELFGDGAAADADSPVLALDVISAAGTAERWLVPGTETRDPDASSTLVYEDATQRVYLLWQTYYSGLHPFFHLVSFDGAAWSEVIQIGGALFTERGSPQLTITRDAGGGEGEEDRTILHLAWWERVPGTSRKLYALILIEGGSYVGTPPLIDLASFPSVGDEPLPSVVGLENAIAMRRGKNDQTVVLGFLNPDTHRLVTLEAELLPRALSDLADEVRAHIVLIGREIRVPGELADSVRERMREVGTSFHEATLSYLADRVAEIVRSLPGDGSPESVAAIADEVRAHIVLIGREIRVGGLMDFSESEILTLGPSASGRHHYLSASVVSDRPAPEVGGPAELLLSESGRNVIVTWEEEGRVYYRESQGEEWSEAGEIELSEDLDRDAVYRMLEERVRTD